MYRPLIAGIDTLEIGYCIGTYLITEAEWISIDIAKEGAQSTLYEQGKYIEFYGYQFMVHRTGSRRYRYILSNNDIQVTISPEAKSGRHFPEVRITFRSEFLWRKGWKYAIEKIDAWVRIWAVIAAVQISRVDSTVDMIGSLPELSPDFIEVVTRAKSKSEFGNFERYGEGTRKTGYRFGGSDLMCRIYDKTEEIKKSKKDWFKHLWRKAGWSEKIPVTRVEFQCRRKVLKQMQIETIDDLLLKLPDLWKELTYNWLTIRIPCDDSHRTRWGISDFWLYVQDAVDWFGEVVGVSRLKQMKPRIGVLESNFKGYLLNIAAWALVAHPELDKEYSQRYIVSLIMRIFNEPDIYIEIEKRKHKFDDMDK